jgi:hypothetical protein
VALVAAGISASVFVAPGSASVAPRWYADGKLITKHVHVATKGRLRFKVGSGFKIAICDVMDKEVISNPPGGGAGTAEITRFKATGCRQSETPELCGPEAPKPPPQRGVTVTARQLPWRSQLVSGENGVVFDEIQAREIDVHCKNESFVYVFNKGALYPKVGTSVLEFTELGGGELRGEEGIEDLFVEGIDALEGQGRAKTITAA